MKRQMMCPMILVAVVGVACGGDESRRGTQQSYETVQEGSAAGVTSTIHGPGEILPPATGTNVDTTSAFTIDPNVVGTATYTPPPAYPPPQTSASPTPPPPAPEPEPEPAPPPPTDTAPPVQEEPEEEEEPPPPPTTTDTRGQ